LNGLFDAQIDISLDDIAILFQIFNLALDLG